MQRATAFLRRVLPHLVLASLVLIGSGTACASGLQVSPVLLTIKADQAATGLWLSNTGTHVLHAQVRVYRWTQLDGTDRQQPSRGLVVSPPMLTLQPGQKQLVRVIRTGAPPNGPSAMEQAYRLAVDELPVDTRRHRGLAFILHYSLPVFVDPAGKAAVTPRLHWQLQRDGAHAMLRVSNNGTGHAQLAGVSFTDTAGHTTVINDGLLGYVLPGSTMQWPVPTPVTTFDGGGTLTVRINGMETTRHVALVPARP